MQQQTARNKSSGKAGVGSGGGSSSASSAPAVNSTPKYVRSVPVAFVIFLIVVIIFIVLVLIIVDANSKKTTPKSTVGFAIGGPAVFTAPNVFIDDIVLVYLSETMTEISTKCNLDQNTNPPVVPLVLGSYADTTNSWTAAKAQLDPVCDFYGLYSMEQRTAALEGPLDFCYAYTSAGFQLITVYYNNTLPFDFLGKLLSVYSIAYPLQMYWDRSTFTSYDVASDFLTQADAYITAVRVFQAGGGSIQAPSIQPYQQSFCNKYFGQNDLSQYNSIFQPWLAFPFEGLIQKLADTAITNSLMQLLGPIDFTPGSEFKAIYTVGSQFVDDPRIDLFSAALMGGITVQNVLTSPAVALPAIKQSLFDGPVLNASKIPIFVLGSYTDDIPFYNSFDAPGISLLMGFAENSNTQTQSQLDINLATALQSALGARFMSSLDFATIHPYEIAFGPSYIDEKFVADIITLCIGTQVNAQSTASDDILNTFSLKNTLIKISPTNIVDLGGRLTQEQAIAAYQQEGASLGLKMPPFSVQLTESTPLGGNLTASAEILGTALPPPLPLSFDWRDARPECLPPTINQAQCNNCWAIASTRSMSIRACIQNPGMTYNQFMSTYHVTTCSNLPQGKNGCDPQYPQTGYTFMTGDVHTQQCMPTVLTGASATGCQQSCNIGSGGSLADVSGIQGGSYVKLANPTDIKISLVNNGPLSVGFSVPTNFLQFFPLNTPNSGIYLIDPRLFSTAGHMVVLVGFDDRGPIKYWIIQNSWGVNQGVGGYLKVQQDAAGLLSKSVMWIDRFAWEARPRPRVSATSPTAVLFNRAAAANPTVPQPRPTVFTSQLGCPTLVVNTNQSTRQANLQGCPNSAGSLTTASTPVKTSGGNVIGAGSKLSPRISIVLGMMFACVMMIY